jgi:hypothetical protein
MVRAALTKEYRVHKQLLRDWVALFPARFQADVLQLLVDHVRVELQFKRKLVCVRPVTMGFWTLF